MPITEDVKQTIEQKPSEGQSPLGNVRWKLTPKAAGTRVGILQDWRGATSGRMRRRGNQMRDGR